MSTELLRQAMLSLRLATNISRSSTSPIATCLIHFTSGINELAESNAALKEFYPAEQQFKLSEKKWSDSQNSTA